MKKALLAFLILASTMIGANAGLILSDTFSYPNGNLTSVSTNVWYAHGNIGGSPILVTNGMARLVGATSAEDDSSDLAGAPYATNSGVTLYSSYSLLISNQAGLPTS